MDLDIETKKRFQKLILPEGITYSKESGFGTVKLGLIYEVNRQFDDEKTDLVDHSIDRWNLLFAEIKIWSAFITESKT